MSFFSRSVSRGAHATFLFLFTAVAAHTSAQSAGTVDPVFGGVSLGMLGKVKKVFVPSAQQVVVAGSFNKTSCVRLSADGSIDTKFVAPAGEYLVFAQQADGKYIVSGGPPYLNGLARLNKDGSIDPTFSVFTDTYVSSVVCLLDGRLVVDGFFTFVDETSISNVALLKADGSVDTSFAPPAGLQSVVAQMSNRQLLALGANGLERLNLDGTIDPAFDVNGASYRFLALQPDGKIVVTNANGGVARLGVDGSLDPSFHVSTFGSVNGDGVLCAALQSDGKIVIGGGFTQIDGVPEGALARLDADGAVDESFSTTVANGYATHGVTTIVMLPDDSFYIGGGFGQVNGVSRSSLAHLSPDGVLDNNFIPDEAPGPDAPVYCVALQPDGNILLGGVFSTVGGTTHNNIVRIKSDGTVDPTFNAQTAVTTYGCDVSGITLLPNGGMLIGGMFTSVNGVDKYLQAELNSDGTLGNFLPSWVSSVVLVQPDGRILVDDGRNRSVRRLNADASIDPSFTGIVVGPGVVLDGRVTWLGDGTYLATGTVNGTRSIVHLRGDGSQDASFHSPTMGVSGVLGIQSTGAIIVEADFENGIEIPVFRLNVDGSVDPSFTATTSGDVALGGVLGSAVQPDDKILIAGQFTHVNGVPRGFVARLNADGTLDPFYNPGIGADGGVNTLTLQPDGKAIICGYFTSVNGVLRNYMARLNSNGAPDFFGGQVPVGNGFYYLQFPNGTPFGYYNLAGNGYAYPYMFHTDLGMEYFYDANDGQGGAYMYDFASSTFFYTSPKFPFPYMYDFTLNTVLYYYPDPSNPGHYNTNGVRYFYNFATGQIISK